MWADRQAERNRAAQARKAAAASRAVRKAVAVNRAEPKVEVRVLAGRRVALARQVMCVRH
jgi:hypothetical protein